MATSDIDDGKLLMSSQLLTESEVAHYLETSESRICQLIHTGELPSVHIGNKRRVKYRDMIRCREPIDEIHFRVIDLGNSFYPFRLLLLDEVADVLKISISHTHRLAYQNELPTVQFGEYVLVFWIDLAEYIEANYKHLDN